MTATHPRIEPAKCSSCGAAIGWVVMAQSGKRMPVNLPPAWVATIESDDRAVMRDGYVSHFVTCPQAQQHRKGRSAAGKAAK